MRKPGNFLSSKKANEPLNNNNTEKNIDRSLSIWNAIFPVIISCAFGLFLWNSQKEFQEKQSTEQTKQTEENTKRTETFQNRQRKLETLTQKSIATHQLRALLANEWIKDFSKFSEASNKIYLLRDRTDSLIFSYRDYITFGCSFPDLEKVDGKYSKLLAGKLGFNFAKACKPFKKDPAGFLKTGQFYCEHASPQANWRACLIERTKRQIAAHDGSTCENFSVDGKSWYKLSDELMGPATIVYSSLRDFSSINKKYMPLTNKFAESINLTNSLCNNLPSVKKEIFTNQNITNEELDGKLLENLDYWESLRFAIDDISEHGKEGFPIIDPYEMRDELISTTTRVNFN
ncbi:hypothetical protein [Chromobacterium violaceum]|uniref:hypothetical protein n=1 Tax=Chromobacterium violaceum TaxID=536 RepID=UPI00111C5DF4|nr:hypothetical protein [Chromobacterium violaceum]